MSRDRRCDLHEEIADCRSDPDSCGWAGCDAHEGDACGTKPRYYADTKSFFCDEGRKQFLKAYRWDDRLGDWVERR